MVFSGKTFDPEAMDTGDEPRGYSHRLVPVWVKNSELHFSLWNPSTISKIASYLGKPIKTDKLAAVKGKLEYARVLIDMRISESVPDRIPIE